MKKELRKKNSGIALFLSVVLVFCTLSAVVFFVAQKTSKEMSNSAIQNLSESLDLLKGTLEALLHNEAEFQQLVAREIAASEDPEGYIRAYEKNETMVKISLIRSGAAQGVSSTGEVFTEGELDFSAGNTVEGLPISRSYLNYMGTWAYSLKCPVERDGQPMGFLYVEYTYDALERSMPGGFYNNQATLYVMDADSERFVLKPKGMGKRSAGHLNLTDFYRANDIREPTLQAEVKECLKSGKDILFYHDIREVRALNYMWSVNDGSIFLVGYVPVEAIQQEGKTVTQNIIIVVMVMLAAFLLCCLLYYFSQRQQKRIRLEREREREVHNKQLAEALRAAQIANTSKTTFLSNMSHDIRTPMNAVLGFTSLLAMDADNPVKVREYTKKITASGQHLLSLINDVLDVSKIESGKVVLNFEPFALSDLVSSVETIIQPMAKGRRHSFHVEVTGLQHEYLIGDETRVNQVLINLLSNAVKYTPEGGEIWLRMIGLKQRSNQYQRIRIEVEDNGYGMTPEYLETIFDAFTRAENSTTNKVQGTGLGMAITKSIVELMGGTIEVFSEVDKGTLFRAELEFRVPEGQADRQFWAERGVQRILAVEPDTETCGNIQLLMKDTGVQVDVAADIQEALKRLEEETYPLVLLDWDGGSQNARALREALPDSVPLLLLAEYDAEGMEALLLRKNTGALTKPFFAAALKTAVLELQAEPEKEVQVPEDDLQGLHFLAAEDNEINAEILLEVLELEGASCKVVENGKLALECFAASEVGAFDAILMDVQMPVMNGYEATRAIRALDRDDAQTIPILAMTANAFAEDEKAALDAGMDVHVAKPIDIAMLKRTIKECIPNG